MTKNIKKLLITVCIVLFAFCLSFAWLDAFATDVAASTNTAGDTSPAASNEGDIIDLSTLTQNLTFGADKTYTTDGDVTTLTYEGNITLTGKTSYSVFFNSGKHDVIFNNVDIQNKTDVVSVEKGAVLNLTVHGNNILKNSGEDTETGRPGLCVGGSGASLTITAASTGTLTAEGGMNSAGIGSRMGQHSFRISILGGTVVASSNGEKGGAGIGSGYRTRGTGFINIENANVTATSGKYAAGIGMGYDATCALTRISIKNSTVVAYGDAAGIGGAWASDCNDLSQTLSISIDGSTVTANGKFGAGIGDSSGSNFTDITIKNSTITAFSQLGSESAGIGSYGLIGHAPHGGYEDEGTITIQDSVVTANGGNHSAGIGGGLETCNGPIIIDRSNINANHGLYGDSDVGAGTGESGVDTTTTPPTNSSGKALSRITITLAGIKNDIPVTAIEGTTDYGTVDLKTIKGKLYLYLPSGDSPTKVIANGNAYTGTVRGDVGTFTFEHTCEVGAKGAAATCTESAVCGACLQYFGEINPEAHAWNNGEITEQPTCMAQGVRTYTCTHNSAHTYTESVEIDPEAHAWDSGEVTEQPTCTEQGERIYTCTHNSAHTYTESVVIDPEAHTWDSGEITTDPTCSAVGIKTYTCTHNSEHTYTEDVAIDENAHAWNEGEVTTNPTCSAVGIKTYTCTHNSAHTKTESVAIDPEAHAWDSGEVTTEPTCSAVGVKTYTCTHNNAHTKTESVEIDPESHAWDSGEVTEQSTCTEQGIKTYTCTRDSSHTKTDPVAIDPDNHTFGEWVKVDENTHKRVCACGEAETDNHSYGEWVVAKEATVTEVGQQTRTCVCGHTETEVIPATGLSGGVIAGIVIGIVAVLGGGGFVIYWLVFKKRKRK